jgi:hypothetical protein
MRLLASTFGAISGRELQNALAPISGRELQNPLARYAFARVRRCKEAHRGRMGNFARRLAVERAVHDWAGDAR